LSASRPSRWSAAGALLLLCAALGCRRDARGGVVVELWAMGREGEVVAQLMPEFERRHPDLRVRVQQVPWSAAHEKLVTAYVGGAMPDVFQAQHLAPSSPRWTRSSRWMTGSRALRPSSGETTSRASSTPT